MRGFPPLRRPGFLGTALAGVVAGHGLTYALAFADPRVRHSVVEETGHGYWDGAIAGAALLGVWVLATLIARTARRARAPRPAPTSVTAAWVLRLAATQAALFAALEVGERLLSGASPVTLLDHGVLWIGVVVQLVTAIAISFLLAAVGRAVELIVSAASRAPGRAVRLPRPASQPLRRIQVLVGAGGVRGPPVR